MSPPTDIPKTLIFLTNRIGRMMANMIKSKFHKKDTGIKSTHMGILVDLWEKDGINQQDLAVSNIKDKATIARALLHLEKNNILIRVSDSNDKRSKLIYLTHKGKSLKETFIPLAINAQQEITQNIDPKELKICINVLSKIYNNLRIVAKTTK